MWSRVLRFTDDVICRSCSTNCRPCTTSASSSGSSTAAAKRTSWSSTTAREPTASSTTRTAGSRRPERIPSAAMPPSSSPNRTSQFLFRDLVRSNGVFIDHNIVFFWFSVLLDGILLRFIVIRFYLTLYCSVTFESTSFVIILFFFLGLNGYFFQYH